MNTKSRIRSVLKASNLDESIAGWPSFNLSALNLEEEPAFKLPTNLRLGHLAERIVSGLFNSSTNYEVLYENVQLIEDKHTIGELDFIIKELSTQRLVHMELAYKFYLYDPSISEDPINNWIGPNRNDSLYEKLKKLKNKQFPLLYSDCAQSLLRDIEIDQVNQVLCFLVSLYIPYKYKRSLDPIYQQAVKGYYISFKEFASLDHSAKAYYLPIKKEWGMEAVVNTSWDSFEDVVNQLAICMEDNQAVLCWQKYKNSFTTFFVVWW